MLDRFTWHGFWFVVSVWSVANICLELCVFWQAWSWTWTHQERVCLWIQLKNKVCPWWRVFWPFRPSSHCWKLILTPIFQTFMSIHSSLLLFMSDRKCRAHVIIYGSYSLCETGNRTQWVFNPSHIYHIHFCFSVRAVQVSAPLTV